MRRRATGSSSSSCREKSAKSGEAEGKYFTNKNNSILIKNPNLYFTVDNHKITSWFLYVQGKLDGYRADYQRGKTLNDDQKAAIAKYDEVSNLL